MGFQPPVEQYSGKIKQVALSEGAGAVTVGGENTLPFYTFEGEMPNRPLIAMEVYDTTPEGWPPALEEALSDVWDDPVKWAKKCQDEYQADAICLQLLGTDPNGLDRSADEASQTVQAVLGAIKVPLIVYGSGNVEKDSEVLKKVGEASEGKAITLGPAVDENYKSVAATAMGFNHTVAGQTPIDVNMAKQLNILMTNLGLQAERILMDPSTGALGYGLEYTYSVIERDKLAALQQNDVMMQMPVICNLGKEVWKTKEAKIGPEDEPSWGDPAKRGILWETLTAVSLLMAGADILIVRHPESAKLVRQTIGEFGL